MFFAVEIYHGNLGFEENSWPKPKLEICFASSEVIIIFE